MAEMVEFEGQFYGPVHVTFIDKEKFDMRNFARFLFMLMALTSVMASLLVAGASSAVAQDSKATHPPASVTSVLNAAFAGLEGEF